jgi:hypothetical protein
VGLVADKTFDPALPACFTLIALIRELRKSLKTLSAPILGGVTSEATLRKPPRGRGSEHFPGKLNRGEEVYGVSCSFC